MKDKDCKHVKSFSENDVDSIAIGVLVFICEDLDKGVDPRTIPPYQYLRKAKREREST